MIDKPTVLRMPNLVRTPYLMRQPHLVSNPHIRKTPSPVMYPHLMRQSHLMRMHYLVRYYPLLWQPHSFGHPRWLTSAATSFRKITISKSVYLTFIVTFWLNLPHFQEPSSGTWFLGSWCFSGSVFIWPTSHVLYLYKLNFILKIHRMGGNCFTYVILGLKNEY